jgi:hypothetical protein
MVRVHHMLDLWAIIHRDLPPLIQHLETMIEPETSP